MNKVKETCERYCLREIKFSEIFDFQFICINQNADLPGNFCKLSKELEMVPGSVSVYLV